MRQALFGGGKDSKPAADPLDMSLPRSLELQGLECARLGQAVRQLASEGKYHEVRARATFHSSNPGARDAERRGHTRDADGRTRARGPRAYGHHVPSVTYNRAREGATCL